MQFELITGKSRQFRATLEELDRYAQSPWPILLTGETGVGKELLAQRIHRLSIRRQGPFVPVNCGALPPGLFESELFGYERGAFSGAVQSHRGLVRSAQGGSLFLDEIGELELGLQVKLLRLLESREIRSVGSTRVEQVDVRFIAATNRNLKERVQEGQFRLDLLERLSILAVEVPPLRERPEDISLLAAGLLDRLGSTYLNVDFSCLLDFEWPGNIRQLRNLLIRADVLGAKMVSTELLTQLIKKEKLQTEASGLAGKAVTGVTLADFEKQVILDKLKRCHGNRKRAAKELGIAKSTLHEKLRKWKTAESDQAWPLYREPHQTALAQ